MPPSKRSRRPPVIPIALGVVVLIALIAILATSMSGGGDGGGNTNDVQQTRPVAVAGEALVRLGEGEDQAVGASAPELDGASFTGTAVSIENDGRPKVLVFLAHWCPHCQREVPVLADWLAENAPDDVDIYGVATATTPDRPNFPPSSWLARERFDVPTLADDERGTAAVAFGLSAFPYFVAVDAEHRVVARTTGELTVAQWESLLDMARE